MKKHFAEVPETAVIQPLAEQVTSTHVTDWNEHRLLKLFERYNRLYWRKKLPKYRVKIAPCHPATAMGTCDWHKRVITVNVQLHSNDRELRATVLHEMVHAATKDGHGVRFFAQLERLLKQGAPITISSPEAGTVRFLSGDVVPARFRLVREKIERAARQEQRRVDRYVKEHDLQTQILDDTDILREFGDRAWEGTWKQVLRYLGPSLGLTDELGRPRSRWAMRIIKNARGIHRRERRLYFMNEKAQRGSHATSSVPVATESR